MYSKYKDEKKIICINIEWQKQNFIKSILVYLKDVIIRIVRHIRIMVEDEYNVNGKVLKSLRMICIEVMKND